MTYPQGGDMTMSKTITTARARKLTRKRPSVVVPPPPPSSTRLVEHDNTKLTRLLNAPVLLAPGQVASLISSRLHLAIELAPDPETWSVLLCLRTAWRVERRENKTQRKIEKARRKAEEEATTLHNQPGDRGIAFDEEELQDAMDRYGAA